MMKMVMKLKIKTQPDLSSNSPKHLEAIAAGNDHFRLWQRNVIDDFKDLPEDKIKEILKERSFPCAVLIENWLGDFNISTAIRNCNAFNCSQVFYIGNRKVDKRGAVGCFNYGDIRWLSTIDELIELQSKYTFIGIDNVPGSIPMEPYIYPSYPLLCFGEEGTGLTPALQSLCKDIIHISMFGSVRSFNCGTASGICLYDFTNKLRSNNFG